jgi:hypothetical protein
MGWQPLQSERPLSGVGLLLPDRLRENPKLSQDAGVRNTGRES